MSAILEGRYFYPNAARFVPARATVVPKRILQIEEDCGATSTELRRTDRKSVV